MTAPWIGTLLIPLVLLVWPTACAAEPLEPAQGLPARIEDLTLEQLEKAFWICDYAATRDGMHATPVAACRFVTEELKRRKFGGDFREMVAWWRLNKAAEYDKLERSN